MALWKATRRLSCSCAFEGVVSVWSRLVAVSWFDGYMMVIYVHVVGEVTSQVRMFSEKDRWLERESNWFCCVAFTCILPFMHLYPVLLVGTCSNGAADVVLGYMDGIMATWHTASSCQADTWF